MNEEPVDQMGPKSALKWDHLLWTHDDKRNAAEYAVPGDPDGTDFRVIKYQMLGESVVSPALTGPI